MLFRDFKFLLLSQNPTDIQSTPLLTSRHSKDQDPKLGMHTVQTLLVAEQRSSLTGEVQLKVYFHFQN